MSRKNGTIVFVLVFLVVFAGSLLLVTDGTLAKFSIGFIPLLFLSELIAFGMVYAATYYDGHEEEEAIESEAKAHAKH